MVVLKYCKQITSYKRLCNLISSRQFGMSRALSAKEAIEKVKESNPYYEKYAEKIAALQKTSPEEFLKRLDKVANKAPESKTSKRTYEELFKPKPSLTAEDAGETPYKKLSDIMKLELIKDKSAEEISQIWIEYHKTKPALVATLKVDQFEVLMKTAKKHPIFLLPLPRNEGFEFIMLQFSGNCVHFTTLLAYQVHAENAPECLQLVHYTEMKDKGLVLMRGEYDSKVLSGQEAQCLVNQMQMFYCTSDENKQKLLNTFTERPNEFKHMDLIKEVENIQLQ